MKKTDSTKHRVVFWLVVLIFFTLGVMSYRLFPSDWHAQQVDSQESSQKQIVNSEREDGQQCDTYTMGEDPTVRSECHPVTPEASMSAVPSASVVRSTTVGQSPSSRGR
jgi:hypothetical protein